MKERLRSLGVLTLVIAAVLSLRLIDLQFARSAEFLKAAEENRMRIREVRAPRGLLLDRRGVLLAGNRLSYDLAFVPAKAPLSTFEPTAKRLAAILGEDVEKLLIKMHRARAKPIWPEVLARDIPDISVARIAWEAPLLPGVEFQAGPVRTYPLKRAAAHAIGYIGEISEPELERMGSSGYSLGDWIGKAGVEQAFDLTLRGRDGLIQYESDPLGLPLRMLGAHPPVSGQTLQLTLDADLCRWADEALANKEGAIVALEPGTGRILCATSSPGFDPSIFVDRSATAERISAINSRGRPFLARAWNSAFPPGSVFKISCFLAGLSSGKISPGTRFHCGGFYQGKRCWNRTGHGSLDLIDALAHSCDVYFYRLAETTGIAVLEETARLLGLSAAPGIGLGPERSGLVPTPEWERANVRGPDGTFWGLGDLLNTVIGQGYVLSSPLQIARMTAAAMVGRRMKPLIIETITDGAGHPIWKSAHETETVLEFSDAQLAHLRTAMLATVERGTAKRVFHSTGFPIGAKTGTAENSGADHAWITVAAPLSKDPRNEPRIVITVLIAHGGHGSSGAGPVARHVLERWAHREGLIDTYAYRPPVVVASAERSMRNGAAASPVFPPRRRNAATEPKPAREKPAETEARSAEPRNPVSYFPGPGRAR